MRIKIENPLSRSKTSNDIIEGNGIEWFMIELKFIEKCLFFLFFKVLLNF